jgi:hypothetical protein
MDLLTVEETAKRLRVKKSWVFTHADEIGVFRLGKYLRFSWPRVLECLDRKSRSLGQSPNDPLRHIDFTACENHREQIGNKLVD